MVSCKIWKFPNLAGKILNFPNLAGKIWKIPDLATHTSYLTTLNSPLLTYHLVKLGRESLACSAGVFFEGAICFLP